MNQPGPRFWEIFFELYESLPRQGPGNRACAARALGLCRDLPRSPAILDLGCGVGGQTLQLAELLPSSSIVAIDSHAPSIERLQAAVAERGLTQRVSALVGDMAHPRQPPGSFDLIWSEGALYSVGLRTALRVCHGPAASRRPPRVHRCGLAQGGPASLDQGQLRPGLPDHGTAGGRRGGDTRLRTRSGGAVHPAR